MKIISSDEYSVDAYTDHPFYFLGDCYREEAPIRKCIVISYDNNKYCRIVVSGVVTTVKRGYLYTKSGRCGEVPTISVSNLPIVGG